MSRSRAEEVRPGGEDGGEEEGGGGRSGVGTEALPVGVVSYLAWRGDWWKGSGGGTYGLVVYWHIFEGLMGYRGMVVGEVGSGFPGEGSSCEFGGWPMVEVVTV